MSFSAWNILIDNFALSSGMVGAFLGHTLIIEIKPVPLPLP